jgi:hypothetical protein
MDADGKILTDPIYDGIGQASDGLIVVESGGKWGAIDYGGNPRIALKYSRLEEFSSGLAPAMIENGRHGYITKDDEVAVDFQFGRASQFNNGSAYVDDWDSGNRGFIDCSGKVFIPMVFDWATLFSEGLASAARERAKIGFIDMEGDWVIPPTLKAAAHFIEGLAPVSLDWHEESWGFMDRNGVWKIPSIYNMVGNFQNGICYVNGRDANTGEGYSAYIDQQNQIVWGPGDPMWL